MEIDPENNYVDLDVLDRTIVFNKAQNIIKLQCPSVTYIIYK